MLVNVATGMFRIDRMVSAWSGLGEGVSFNSVGRNCQTNSKEMRSELALFVSVRPTPPLMAFVINNFLSIVLVIVLRQFA